MIMGQFFRLFILLVACWLPHLLIAQSPKRVIYQLRAENKQHLEEMQIDLIDIRPINEYEWLSMREKEWILLLQHHYDSLLTTIFSHERIFHEIDYYRSVYFEDTREHLRFVEPTRDDGFGTALKRLFEQTASSLLVNMTEYDLSPEDQQFISYYIHFNLHQLDVCDENKQRKSLDEAKRFMEQFDHPSYEKFIRKYSDGFKSTKPLGIDVSLLVGRSMLDGKLGQTLTPHFNFILDGGITYQRLLFHGQFSFGQSRVTSPFFHHVNYEEGRPVNLNALNLFGGYHLFLNERLTVSAFAGPQFNMLTGVAFGFESSEAMNFRTLYAFGYVGGINIDVNFPKYHCPGSAEQFGSITRKHSTYIRLQLMYSQPNYGRTIEELMGSMFSFRLALGRYMPRIEKANR